MKELAFELGLKLELEEIKATERDALAHRIAVLHKKAQELRSEVEERRLHPLQGSECVSRPL